MADLVEVPVLEGDLENKISTLIVWLDGHLEKKKWTNQEYRDKFATRGADEIIQQGDTGYMGSCLDYTLVALKILKENQYECDFIIEFLYDKVKKRPGIHFAIEFDDAETRYFLDFVGKDDVVFHRGDYFNQRGSVDSQKVHRIDGTKIPSDVGLSAGLDDSDLVGAVNPQSREGIVKGIIGDNTDQNYDRVMAERGDEPRLNLTVNI